MRGHRKGCRLQQYCPFMPGSWKTFSLHILLFSLHAVTSLQDCWAGLSFGVKEYPVEMWRGLLPFLLWERCWFLSGRGQCRRLSAALYSSPSSTEISQCFYVRLYILISKVGVHTVSIMQAERGAMRGPMNSSIFAGHPRAGASYFGLLGALVTF